MNDLEAVFMLSMKKFSYIEKVLPGSKLHRTHTGDTRHCLIGREGKARGDHRIVFDTTIQCPPSVLAVLGFPLARLDYGSIRGLVDELSALRILAVSSCK